jgi:hypothetical protein
MKTNSGKLKQAKADFKLFHPSLLRDKTVRIGGMTPMDAVRDIATMCELNYAEYDSLKSWLISTRGKLK